MVFGTTASFPSRSQPKARRPLTILRLSLEIGEQSAPYNQFSLALCDQQNITICTYFRSSFSVPEEITLIEGNDTLKGFFRVLKAALDRKEYDIIHVHSPHLGLFFLVASVFLSRKLIRSTVYTVHNSYQSYKMRNRLMLIPVVAFFRRVVCCSNSSLESFPGFMRWLAGERMCAVQNGVDIDRVDRVVQNGPRMAMQSRFTTVTVGRLIETKRPSSILAAFHRSRNGSSKLLFIGRGHLRDVLLAEIGELGLGKQVEMTGMIPREEVYEHLGNADLFISASGVEGLPIAVLEAMACSCPVILSDIPPHREIAGGVDFIPLVQANDIGGFAEEIGRFQSMSPADRSMLGSRCRELVKERFSLTSMHEGYEKVYSELLGENFR